MEWEPAGTKSLRCTYCCPRMEASPTIPCTEVWFLKICEVSQRPTAPDDHYKPKKKKLSGFCFWKEVHERIDVRFCHPASSNYQDFRLLPQASFFSSMPNIWFSVSKVLNDTAATFVAGIFRELRLGGSRNDAEDEGKTIRTPLKFNFNSWLSRGVLGGCNFF